MGTKKSAKKVKLPRVELDLSQTQLPLKVNARQTNISRFETGGTAAIHKNLSQNRRSSRKTSWLFFG